LPIPGSSERISKAKHEILGAARSIVLPGEGADHATNNACNKDEAEITKHTPNCP
jgi:hypothetical protein